MTLRQQPIDRHIKPFDHIRCPVCGSVDFVELTPAGGVWCDGCNAKFSCRDTAGDPGLVVDCHVEHVWSKVHRQRIVSLIRQHATFRYGGDFGRVDDWVENHEGKPLPVYFYMVCKEPREDGTWGDVRGWNFTNLERSLQLWVTVNPPKIAKAAS